ncbi:MAG TPA: peptide deformylase [Candidatus Saccharimonadales bacterium]|nr:peptide deformylase [Candidatus Saccharimonadales bacterium]
MTKDNIITLPNPHLRAKSRRIHIVTDEVRSLIKNMRKATLDWEKHREHELGVALAAVQVDKLERVVVIRNNFDDKEDLTFIALINPEIVKLEGEIVYDHEGCLSVPDVYGLVPRHSKVRVKALDENGHEIRIKASGFLARILQHEIDHTNGIVFVDHIKDQPKAFFKLKADGQLQQLDYEKHIKKNRILWQ